MSRTALLVLTACLAARAGEGLPENILRSVKDATVLIRVKSASKEGSGTGLLYKRADQAGFLMTNAHVIKHGNEVGLVTVLFRSGEKDEQSVEARVIAFHEESDLAILKVEMAGLPAPISVFATPKPRETQPVYVVGFPFGPGLSISKDKTAATVVKGTISGLRMGNAADLKSVEFFADVNPGNSGGPVVDSNGKLVGITQAKIARSAIGYAIAPRQAELFLECRTDEPIIQPVSNARGVAKFNVSVPFVDPKLQIKSMTISAMPSTAIEVASGKVLTAGAGNVWPQQTSAPLAIDRNAGIAKGELELKGSDATNAEYKCWIRVAIGNATERTMGFANLSVPFSGRDVRINVAVKQEPQLPMSLTSPVYSARAIACEPELHPGLKITTLAVNAENIVTPVLWSADGSRAYVLETNGRLRRIDMRRLREECSVNLGATCSSLQRSREGLVIAVRGQGLCVLDEDTLEFRRWVALPRVRYVSSGPNMSMAFARSEMGNELTVVDLAWGRVRTVIQPEKVDPPERFHKEGARFDGFGSMAVSSDGEFLFTISNKAIHRFKIDAGRLKHEEAGPSLGDYGQLVLSADNAYVSLINMRNTRPSDHPESQPDTTYIYKTTNLQMPAGLISVPWFNPGSIAFDCAASKIFATDGQNIFMVFDAQTRLDRKWLIPDFGRETKQILPFHEGRKALILNDKRLAWVEITD